MFDKLSLEIGRIVLPLKVLVYMLNTNEIFLCDEERFISFWLLYKGHITVAIRAGSLLFRGNCFEEMVQSEA